MQPDDHERLRHMLDAAHEARMFAEGRSRTDLEDDRMLTMALLKELEIVGEAAYHLSEKKRGELPEIPWPEIIGMRHRLVHAYHDIDLDVLWDTVTANLPPFIEALEKALADER